MQIELDGTRRVTRLVQTQFAERNRILSPDLSLCYAMPTLCPLGMP